MEKATHQSGSISWTGVDILAATGGCQVCGELSCRFSTVSIDSRSLSDTAFFVAIVGKTHDGHRFCGSVVDSGVQGVLINQDAVAGLPVDQWRKRSVFCVAVADTTRALGDLAAYHRRRNPATVAAVTGSCGKTTTREMAASVLGQRYHTLSSRKNFNNEIGLPLTLLDLEAGHDWVVAELGMNRVGEISRLGEICRPDVGVITNIGTAHLGGLGSVENVMTAKGELLPFIKSEGTAVLNADDPRGRLLAEKAPGRRLLFGEAEDADIRGRRVYSSGVGAEFELVLPTGGIPVSLPMPGRFMVPNALAAAAVGYLAGLAPDRIKAGLESFRPVSGRMNLVETVLGIHILDDTYNANPTSMAAAIETLTGARGNGRGIVVLGDMLELGSRAEEFHWALGEMAADSGVDRVYTTGVFAEVVAAGAREKCIGSKSVVSGSHEEILADLKNCLAPDDWVLVKGSRVAGMESIVSDLVAWAGGRRAKDEG